MTLSTVAGGPDDDGHPRHAVEYPAARVLMEPVKPLRLPSRGQQFVRERNCQRAGGHWWHPDPDNQIVGWFCCQCGKTREGMPEDGR